MNSTVNVRNWKSMRPKLTRQDAIAPPAYIEDEHITNIEEIDFNTLQIYLDNKYSYTNCHSRMIIDGYTHTKLSKYIPSDINAICFKYYFSSQTSLFAIAYKLWNIYQSKHKKYNQFTVYNLVSELLNINKDSSNKLIRNQFIDLIENKYIEPKYNKNVNNLYKFTANSIIEFQEYRKYLQKYDRKAWNIGTVVEIKSTTFQTWLSATIISIKNINNITVVFRKNNKIIKKTVNRYDYKSIRSTNEFINNRKSLTINSCIKIYDAYDNKWYNGSVTNIIKNKYNEMLYIKYTKEYDCVNTNLVNRWSSEIKIEANAYSENILLNKYKKGNHCNVWSISQNNWVSAMIKMIIPNQNCILVKYKRYQKIIDITNHNIHNIVLL